MYSRRLSQPPYPNLKLVLAEGKSDEPRLASMLRQTPLWDTFTALRNVKNRVEEILRRGLGGPRSLKLKEHSASVLRVWAHQCECVFAQRLRRGQQMFSLYSRLWDERALRDFARQMRHRLGARGRDLFWGALGVAVFDWRCHRISDKEIQKHEDEMDYVHLLRDKTLCGRCSKTSSVCRCERFEGTKPQVASYDNWTLFIEKNDLVVWRRLHASSGNYEYKVYGSYSDVSAEDFLNVQIDIDYRRQWDKTAVSLNVVEKDPDRSTNSDVVYWEMLWPKLFANRDYVFVRRYMVDYKSKTLYLFSKSTKHPRCPKENTKFRIEDYWSYMVIKPYTEMSKPGIEFSLTYYDNPGVNIPATVTTWVAMKAMPDFLGRLREASKKYKKYCRESGACQLCNIIDRPTFAEPLEEGEELAWDYFDDEVTDNTVYEAHFKVKEPPSEGAAQPKDEEEGSTSGGPSAQPESNSFWRYLQPTYYFS